MAMVSRSEDLLTLGVPELMQGSSTQRTIVDHALGVLAIDDFPGFPDWHALRKKLAVEDFEAPTTPDALHSERFENDWLCVCHLSYFSEAGPLCNSFREPFAVLAGSAKLARIENFDGK